MIFSRNVSEALAAVFKGCGGGLAKFPVAMARGKHLFPFRTEQLSPSAPMVLGPQGPGRVGRRRFAYDEPPPWAARPRWGAPPARRRCGGAPTGLRQTAGLSATAPGR